MTNHDFNPATTDLVNAAATALAGELRNYPFDLRAAADLLAALSPDAGRAAERDAVLAAVRPDAEMTADDAEEVLTLLDRWSAALAAQQRQQLAAFAEARRLMDLHGDEDPRAMLAVIHAVNLADPGYIDNALVECGIHLPTATHHDKDGAPLFSLDAIAEALDADPDDLMGLVDQMEDSGLCVRPVVAGRLM